MSVRTAISDMKEGFLFVQLVPTELRGRVESVDWLVSVGLVPVSFALTGPLAAAFGAQETIIGAGLIGGC